MNFEIEKKFITGSFKETLNELTRDFGDYKKKIKKGFWFCTNYSGNENILDIAEPKFHKKDVKIIKDITEQLLPEEDFQYMRLRFSNNASYIMTFKNKSIVNNIEKNNEYEFELDKEVFERAVKFLSESSFIFYYNIKESYEFTATDIKIELSNISDLKDSYIEVEVTGNKEKELMDTLNFRLKKFELYNIKEEPKSYLEIFLRENAGSLKNQKLGQFSKKAFLELEKLLK